MLNQSAVDDLYRKTLARIDSAFAALQFLASRRALDGSGYSHWGLKRAYGAEKASAALASAHSDCYLRLVQKGFPELFRDAQIAAETESLQPAVYLQRLWERRATIVPEADGGAPPSHLEWLLFVLSKATQRAALTAHRAA